ncbi:MAG: hypothetical protein WC655_15310, partial [Candidatus Hydrogenedentales bacterium]
MNKLLSKPTATVSPTSPGLYERFFLSENPFPPEPVVNPESSDKRVNGQIYVEEIRASELKRIEDNFIKHPQSDPMHLRLGLIADTSYIGRGNGKSAFLVNLKHRINSQFALDLSSGQNKCFAVVVQPH